MSTTYAVHICTFEAHKIDQMRDVLSEWGLKGFEIKATFTYGTGSRAFVMQKILVPVEESAKKDSTLMLGL